ncbi:hypothetical protein, partial [Nocardia farcinica]|uniref:hypothetical protein n=1 Tax=Nocardia farcinica TaxID=37329 RepID=UPI0034DB1169
MTNDWREGTRFTASLARSGLLTMEIVRDTPGGGTVRPRQVIFRPSDTAEPDMSIAGREIDESMLATVVGQAHAAMARHGWTDADQLAAVPTMLSRRLSAFADRAGGGPWR